MIPKFWVKMSELKESGDPIAEEDCKLIPLGERAVEDVKETLTHAMSRTRLSSPLYLTPPS
ncbi:MAG: hypothetical protein NZ921_03715 [Candidatus Caldarchaeum sp.]|nr:hypothetical protein [Candidatus Caldarchaeum sp.]